MLFSSEIFLFFFLPVVIAVYYGLLKKTVIAKNMFLLAASLFFYAWGNPKNFGIMLGCIIMNYLFGLAVDAWRNRKILSKLTLIAMLVYNLGILGLYKYSAFAIAQINRFLHTSFTFKTYELPLGISFFTFQAMSYVIDVYRNHSKVQKNPFYVGLYISLFPQLIAGPIVRYETIADQIENRKENLNDFTAGITRFCIGMGKKVLIANNISVVADASYDLLINGQYQASTLMAWLGAISYGLQLYFDFSAYSDMAIGLGRMFGFHFNENFNYPFMSANVTDFWRRWHISMGTWFRDYVYIPLGGNRVSKKRHFLNLFIVWLLTGIWHGANWTFVVWGLFYFVFLAIEKYTGLAKKDNILTHIYAVLMYIIGFVFFRSDNLTLSFVYLKAMFGIGTTGFANAQVFAYIKQEWIFYIIAIIGCAPVLPKLENHFKDNKAWNTVYAVTIVAVFVLCISYIANNAYSPFIYFNF